MREPANFDLVRELDDPERTRDPELEVDIELLDDALFDAWFCRTEAEIAQIEDDPTAKVLEIRIANYPAFEESVVSIVAG